MHADCCCSFTRSWGHFATCSGWLLTAGDVCFRKKKKHDIPNRLPLILASAWVNTTQFQLRGKKRSEHSTKCQFSLWEKTAQCGCDYPFPHRASILELPNQEFIRSESENLGFLAVRRQGELLGCRTSQLAQFIPHIKKKKHQ